MKKCFLLLGTLATFLMTAIYAGATSIRLGDLDDLEHSTAYQRRLTISLAAGEQIIGASITFKQIANYNTQNNDLYVTLINSSFSGSSNTKTFGDTDNGANNYFSSWGQELVHYHNLGVSALESATPRDITYQFNAANLQLLNDYLLDSKFSLGFDPDCHFYNEGILFSYETGHNPVPEPATMLLFGTGIAGLASWGRSRKK